MFSLNTIKRMHTKNLSENAKSTSCCISLSENAEDVYLEGCQPAKHRN